MLGVEGFSSIRCCFTATDFDDALIEINAILRDPKKRNLEQAYKLAYRCLVETSHRKPDKQLSFLLADMIWRYAREYHEENALAAKQMLLVALNMHLFAIGMLDDCINMREFNSLEDLRKQSEAKPNLFAFMEHIAATTDPSHCATTALKSTFMQAYPERRLLSLAETLRWLGQAYKNLDAFKKISAENENRFANLFGASEALFLLVGTEESKLELADLYYEAWPFMHQRLHPNDVAGACALYDKALSSNPSNEMHARVANRRFLALFAEGKEEDALKHIRKAITMAETLQDTEQNRFLLANLYFNYSCALLRPNNFDLEQAEIHLTRAVRYAAQSRARGRDHIYFAIYDMRIAEFKMARGEFAEAKAASERALETLKKYPHSQQPHIFKCEALLSLIGKMANLTST